MSGNNNLRITRSGDGSLNVFKNKYQARKKMKEAGDSQTG
jgi:hypothetical protein